MDSVGFEESFIQPGDSLELPELKDSFVKVIDMLPLAEDKTDLYNG